MDPALASLLGAIVGGTLTGGTNLALEMYRGRRADAASKAAAERDAHRAARLIEEELAAGHRLLIRARDRNNLTWDPATRPLPTASWTEFRAEWAAVVGSDDDWYGVADAFAEFDRLNWLIIDVREEDAFLGHPESNPMDGEPVPPAAHLEDRIAIVERGLDVLRRARVR